MTKTKHEGLYFRKNKYNKKVFYARFKIEGKAHLKKLGSEPSMSTTTAALERQKLIATMTSAVCTVKTVNDFFDDYTEIRRATLSDSWHYNIIKNYNLHLKKAIGSKYPTDVNSMEIQAIINNMLSGENEKHKKYAPSTVKQIKDCVGGLYRYIIRSGFEIKNVGSELVIPKFDNKVYFTISDESAQRLFDVIINLKNYKWRVYFIWLLHGRRKMETAQMRWEWMDFNNMTYRVPVAISKPNKDVIAPITEFLKAALEDYGVEAEGYIFKGSKKRENLFISESGIDSEWKNIRAFAGLPKMRLHDIRHLIGFMGLKSGYSLEMVGNVLGHESTATTKRYSNMKSDSAKEVLNNMFGRFVQ